MSNVVKTLKRTFVGLMTGLSVSAVAASGYEQLDQLLDQIENDRSAQQKVVDQRLAKFRADKEQQAALLAEAKKELAGYKARSQALENEFQANDRAIDSRVKVLDERTATFKEMLGVLGQATGDMISTIDGSPVTSQFPERREFVLELARKAGSSNEIPSIAELKGFNTVIFQELIHGGRTEKYEANYVDGNGEAQSGVVTRVGTFNVIKDGVYLNWDELSAKLVEFAVQPKGGLFNPSKFLSTADAVESAAPGAIEPFWLDPSSGNLLALEKEKPTLSERINVGGTIGYIIIALGVLGVILAIWRYLSLGAMSLRIRQQMKSSTPSENNPLGRVQKVFNKHEAADTETLELHMSEAITSESPRVTKYIQWIKIISVVAPLLGLLGTVTGMINVFETMSLFGNGDPKQMSGGISQALVTTVLGLVVAIPTLFLHAFVHGKARDILTVLEERSLGIMARHAEKQHKTAA
ncbi:MAG: MotA/TolQ/ExbB proton channel family protein [Pseudomonadota bacterium]|nr:MotA/TolQ/ExbB proton channel family protein [Pseudomonadota bacterium]